KELMVLSSGKKMVPSYLEGLLLGEPCIDQAVVCGEGRNYLTALIVPQWDNLQRALRDEGLAGDGESCAALARNPKVRDFLLTQVQRALVDLSQWEQVKRILVLAKPFTVADDELTVSLKLRRQVIFTKYAAQIDALYRE